MVNTTELINISNALHNNQLVTVDRNTAFGYWDLARTNGFRRIYPHLSNFNLPNRQLIMIIRDVNNNYMVYGETMSVNMNRNRPALIYIRILH